MSKQDEKLLKALDSHLENLDDETLSKFSDSAERAMQATEKLADNIRQVESISDMQTSEFLQRVQEKTMELVLTNPAFLVEMTPLAEETASTLSTIDLQAEAEVLLQINALQLENRHVEARKLRMEIHGRYGLTDKMQALEDRIIMLIGKYDKDFALELANIEKE